MNPFVALFRSIGRQVEQKRKVALCTVVAAHGSTPQSPGASLLLHENMTTEGTLGGGCVEAEIRKQASELLRDERSALLTFTLDHDYGWDDGLICGGTMRVAVTTLRTAQDIIPVMDAADAIEQRLPAELPIRVEHEGAWQEFRLHIEPPARLLIAGAGHVGAQLARMAVDLDFDVTVIDDRADLASPDRLLPPIRCKAGDIEASLKQEDIDANTYAVIVTRGHNHDEQALAAVVGRGARYVGMIGSRRKIKLIFDDLAALGIDRRELEKVHAPIGLPIGAVTVPEIAVSILAQLIEERRVQKPTRVEGPLTVQAGEAS